MMTREQAIKELQDELALYMEEGAEGVAARIRVTQLEDAIDRLEHGEPLGDVLSEVL